MRGRIRQRSKGSWELTVNAGPDADGKRRQVTETVRGGKSEAQKRMSELLTEVQRGGYVKTSRSLTVCDYLRDWLKNYVQMNCAPKTIESYTQLIEKHIIPEIGGLHLIDLEPRQLQLLYTKKKESGLSSRTVKYLYNLTSEALTQAVKAGILNRNVALATTPPRIERITTQTLLTEDVSKFLKAAESTSYFALFYCLLHTGMRRGEALALRWRDIDLGMSSLGVQAYLSVSQSLSKVNGIFHEKEPKTAAGKRRVALSPSLALVLRQHKAQKATLRTLSDNDYVFCHPDGSPLDPSTVSHAFADLLARAGLPAMPLHGLRHSHATMLLQAGVNPKVVGERLGHSSIRVTLDTYSHVVAGLQEDAARKFDEFLAAKDNNSVDKMWTLPNITECKS